MGGRVSAERQFVVATIAAYWGYPPEPRSNSRTNSGLPKIRRKVSLDFAKFDWTRHASFFKQLVLLTRVSLRHIRCRERGLRPGR
jgi:hypothetical protein